MPSRRFRSTQGCCGSRHRLEECVFNRALRARSSGDPEPELPQPLQGLHADGGHRIVRPARPGRAANSGWCASAEKCVAKTRVAPQRVRSSGEASSAVQPARPSLAPAAVDLPHRPRGRPLHQLAARRPATAPAPFGASHGATPAQRLHAPAAGSAHRSTGAASRTCVQQASRRADPTDCPDRSSSSAGSCGKRLWRCEFQPFAGPRAGKVRAQRQHRHLRFAERRAEVLVGLQRVHPAAEGLLPAQQIADRLCHLRIVRRDARSLERPERMAGLEFGFGLRRLESHGPLPVGPLQREDPLRVAPDLSRVCSSASISASASVW